MSSDDQLNRIVGLLKARDFERAYMELTSYLKAHPDQPEAWYLMSFAVGERARQIAALERALKLDPTLAKASTRLIKLQSIAVSQTPAPSSRRFVLLLLALLSLGALVVFGILIVSSSSAPHIAPTILAMPPTDTQQPPTQVTTQSVSSTPTPTLADTAVTAASATSTEEVIGTVNATAQSQDTVVSSTDVPEDTVVGQTTSVAEAPTSTLETVASTIPTATSVENVAAPTVEQPTQSTTQQPSATGGPTSSPTQEKATVAPTPTTLNATTVPPTITPTFSTDQGVPLQSPLNVGNGQMRVVSVAFPATNSFKDLGITAPAPPSGNQWALVEAFITCSQNSNCGPDVGSIKILGSSGKTYPVTTAFSIDPQFGPQGYTPGQVWGYLEFAVATGESKLRLTLTQGGQTYTFALQ